MYDVKQFKPALYALLLLGFAGFGMAAQSPGLWAFSSLFVLLNAWMVKTGTFKPLPRMLAGLITLLGLLIVVGQFSDKTITPILAIAVFLVLLQIVKVWEQRANRDYAQLLVLSLLLMVAAAISTSSLVFGILFIAYLFLSLYCCLLFHLKMETDEARLAMALPEESINPNQLRQDQRRLSSSMRRLTGLISTFAIVCAVVIFLFFPRGSGANFLSPFQMHPTETLTGFNDHINFQNLAKITQNTDKIATVKIWKDDQLQSNFGTLLLRGITHDFYSGSDENDKDHAQYEWAHMDQYMIQPEDGSSENSWEVPRGGTPHYRQEISLKPTGTLALFAMAGVVSIKSDMAGLPNGTRLAVRYLPGDETLQNAEPLNQPVKYVVFSSGQLSKAMPDPTRLRSRIDPLIAQLARRREVSGGLAERRDALYAQQQATGEGLSRFYPTQLDGEIARHIENYLQSNYTYTLDLTDVQRIAGRDPIVAFLYDFRRGHCEYFAGAMTMLCQSLGLEARMVIGFKCDEYNDLGHFYNVKQSDAHAWVEVLTTTGWQTFDPTSSRVAGPRQAGMLEKTRHFFEFLEYKWANAVIAYDVDSRDSILRTMDTSLTNTAVNGSFALSGLRPIFDKALDTLAKRAVGPLIILLTLALAGSVGFFIYERWKLRRIASRIGLDSLPSSDQLRLVRQLGFYDDLLRILERNRITRPKHLTPLEFSDTLSYLPSESYRTIRRLTELFYRVRYGHSHFNASQQRRLGAIIHRLGTSMKLNP